MAKFYYCDYVTSVNGSRALLLEKKLLPFVKERLFHKVFAAEDIEYEVEIIRSEQSMIRREFPRLRSLNIRQVESSLPEIDRRYIYFGDCYARLEPVLNCIPDFYEHFDPDV